MTTAWMNSMGGIIPKNWKKSNSSIRLGAFETGPEVSEFQMMTECSQPCHWSRFA